MYTCSNIDETEGCYIDESSQRQKNSETEKSSVKRLGKGREEVQRSLAKSPNQEELILVFYSIVDELC